MLEIYGTEVPEGFVEAPIGVQFSVANGKKGPKHVQGAYLLSDSGKRRDIPGGRVLMVEEGADLRLSVGYEFPGENLGFGVKVDAGGEQTFVDELYFPSVPRDGWVYGLVDRGDDGTALRLDSTATIDRLHGSGEGKKRWALSVSVWPILEWGDRENVYKRGGPRLTSTRSGDLRGGGLVSGQRVGETTSGRHMRIIRSAVDQADSTSDAAHRVFDLRIYLFVASAERLGRPVLAGPGPE